VDRQCPGRPKALNVRRRRKHSPPHDDTGRPTAIDARPATDSIVIRIAGDSGDGVQLMGTQFVTSTAVAGNDFATFPDYPAEIRAPTGTTFGVSAYQINFGAGPITTAGDAPLVLVAFNPAALKVSLPLIAPHALIILNTDTFTARNLSKAGYAEDPRESGVLDGYQVIPLDLTRLTMEAVKEFGLSKSDAGRCKNFYALGVLLWMFERDTATIERWVQQRFAKAEVLLAANLAALRAGHAYGETAELSAALPRYHVTPAKFPPGEYRGIRGSDALALGLAAAGELADRPLMFCSYPITPASPLLHRLAKLGDLGVGVFQAEDEIAAVCAAIGASYAGAIGVTSSSGPGIALKTEAIGLAINAELPLVVIDSQRGGPSTGLPTKTEQSDLYQAVYGRNADAPLPVLAASSPSDCFDVAIEAVRIAVRHMTPVILLTDGYLANAAEPWKLPDIGDYAPIAANLVSGEFTAADGEAAAFRRDPATLGRPWITPGQAGLMYRVGGLEKDIHTGQISYDAANHARMSEMRAAKVRSVAKFIPDQDIAVGPRRGRLAVVGWGSTYGSLYQAVRSMSELGVSHIHIRHLSPLPGNLSELLAGFERVLVPEMNMGQLATLLRDKLGIDPVSLPKVTGQPFLVEELRDAISHELGVTSLRRKDAI
jgi:2-oxoglutarate ferredoxin oxidoreductase subunit alpha